MKTVFIIFGATGDLSKRKLFPALYNIFLQGKKEIDIIAIGRRKFSNNDFLEYIEKETNGFIVKKDNFKDFLNTISYSFVEINKSDGYKKLRENILGRIEKNVQIIFYLSIASDLFFSFLENYKHIGIKKNVKIMFEKPFGKDLESATKLNNKINEIFNEEQIYRIDHYVAKESIQNILAFRFSNKIFETIWNNKYIDDIQIIASESIGILNRGEYYDNSGALRDMIQNHILQMITLVAMNKPMGINAKDISKQKFKVLNNIKFGKHNDIVFGQYNGYKKEYGVKKNSKTETFVATRVEVNTKNFKGIPIYIKTGKYMKDKKTIIVIEFKKNGDLFNNNKNTERNRIVMELYPNEGIRIIFNIKENGNDKNIENIRSAFKKELLGKEAYERIIENAINGEKMIFTNWNILKKSWEIVNDIVTCTNNCPILHYYDPNTDGPIESDNLLKKDGFEWYNCVV